MPGSVVKENDGVWECVDHGPQPEPTYRYSFKDFVLDETGTTLFTFFTPIADALTRHECSALVQKLRIPNPKQILPKVLTIKDEPASVGGKIEMVKCIP
ncbi:nucleic acid-binding, OB-fold protein, partial [Tanacetum coccineum]